MATLTITDDEVIVELSTVEKVGAIHGDVRVPRSAIREVSVADPGLSAVHGWRIGTGVPGLVVIGRFISDEGTTFAVCGGRGAAVVIDLDGQDFHRLVVVTDDPQADADRLRGAV